MSLEDAPVTMRELAILFIECSKTCTPALVLSKYLKSHYEEVFKRSSRGSGGEEGGGDGSGLSNAAPGSGMDRTRPGTGGVTYMGEPWDEILTWCDTAQDWSVCTGLNFVQFIDCIAKIGILAYSTAKFDQALPNPADKVQHFLGAHMQLGGEDAHGGSWKMKVDQRLSQVKSKIKATIHKPAKKKPTADTAAAAGPDKV